LVEVVCFFVTHDLARNKTGSVKDGMTELNLKGKLVTDGLQNVQRITKLNLKGHFVTDDLQNITFKCE
jgi:hypothetical protein